MTQKIPLPIDQHLSGILKLVQDYSTILVKASPGSGKTTRLPWYLASHLEKKTVVLEPRRLAAKMAALRIAEEESLTIGQEIGFHFRFENTTSSETRLIFYTEGTFLKRFLNDPLLSDTEIIILDEFHERHLDTDLALALIRELQTKRPELKIILMSATLDTTILTKLSDAKLIEVEAPMYPVETQFLPNQPSILNQSLEVKVRNAIEETKHIEGDVLVFLPGMREMLKTQSILTGNYDVFLLHADLSKEEQEQAVHPTKRKKIILATNIAESSVTIPGIKVVIDSGIQREAYYSPWNGLRLIRDVPITKSSAIQRAGRAGRTSAGFCYRLYSEHDYRERAEFTVPEIERADLTDTYLLLQGIGLSPKWFEDPPKDKWQKAYELLVRLGAIEENGALTSIGSKMLKLPLDARLSRILVAGENLPLGGKKKLLNYICREIEEDQTGMLFRRLQNYLKHFGNEEKSWEECIITGFIDQVGRLRPKQHDFIHYSGKTIKLHHSFKDLHDEYYLILDITQRQEAIKVFPIEESWFWNLSPFPLSEEDTITVGESFQIINRTKLGSIVIEETSVKARWSELTEEQKNKINTEAQNPFIQRISRWKETSEFERLHYWGRHNGTDLETFLDALKAKDYFEYQEELNWEGLNYYLLQKIEGEFQLTNLSQLLPESIPMGNKRTTTVHYPFNMEPFIEAPIQDFYGKNETPTIMNGQIPLTLKLLGPHKRPIQVTKDLKGFWQKTYQEMKKEYQREYPRHYWPDEPWNAKPVLLKRMLDS